MKTERMTLLMTAEEKAAIVTRAQELHLSASELVRRAIETYEPAKDEAMLSILAQELTAVVDRTEAKLDAALVELESMRAFFARVDREKRDKRLETVA